MKHYLWSFGALLVMLLSGCATHKDIVQPMLAEEFLLTADEMPVGWKTTYLDEPKNFAEWRIEDRTKAERRGFVGGAQRSFTNASEGIVMLTNSIYLDDGSTQAFQDEVRMVEVGSRIVDYRREYLQAIPNNDLGSTSLTYSATYAISPTENFTHYEFLFVQDRVRTSIRCVAQDWSVGNAYDFCLAIAKAARSKVARLSATNTDAVYEPLLLNSADEFNLKAVNFPTGWSLAENTHIAADTIPLDIRPKVGTGWLLDAQSRSFWNVTHNITIITSVYARAVNASTFVPENPDDLMKFTRVTTLSRNEMGPVINGTNFTAYTWWFKNNRSDGYQYPSVFFAYKNTMGELICQEASFQESVRSCERYGALVLANMQTPLVKDIPKDAIPTDSTPKDLVFYFSRGACMGTCPIYSFTVYRDGTIYYDGESYVDNKGFYVGHVPADDVKKLADLYVDRKYFSLEDHYEEQVTDMSSVSTGIQYDGRTKSVYNYGDYGPEMLNDLENELDATLKKTNLTPIQVSKEVCDKIYSNEFAASWEIPFCYKKIQDLSCSEVGLKVKRSCYQRINEGESIIYTQYASGSSQIATIEGIPFNSTLNLTRSIDEDLTESRILEPMHASVEMEHPRRTISCMLDIVPCTDVEQFEMDLSKILLEVDLSGNFVTSVRPLLPYGLNKKNISMWITRVDSNSNKTHNELIFDGCIAGDNGVCFMWYNASYSVAASHPPPNGYVVFTEEEKDNIFFEYQGVKVSHERVPYFNPWTPYVPQTKGTRVTYD